jgi:hypothetical protein
MSVDAPVRPAPAWRAARDDGPRATHLLRCPDPQPLTAREAADELAALPPAVGWTKKKVEHLVKEVRDRLSGQGVGGLVPEPGRTGFDSACRRNLIDALLGTGTLGAADLPLLDGEG